MINGKRIAYWDNIKALLIILVVLAIVISGTAVIVLAFGTDIVSRLLNTGLNKLTEKSINR